MAFKKLLDKARKVYEFKIHDETVHFAELGFDAEMAARETGVEYAKQQMKEPTDSELDEYAQLYVQLEMLRHGGEDVDVDEFFSLPGTYHSELTMVMGNMVGDVIHAEAKKLREELRRKIISEGKRRAEE